MTEHKPAPPLIVRTFMTHDMKDDDIVALSTGRDDEFRRIMGAIERSRQAAPGALQHVVLYGSRGFGKSFMARRVQIAVAELDPAPGRVLYVLLPEEQHNLQRSPHAFLDTIKLKIEHARGAGDAGYEAALFQWPKPEEAARRWEESAAQLDAAVAAALPGGKGLVIVVVENFDVLVNTLFKEDEDEQRLRQWLDRKHNRVMLFATATGTVDVDYDRPLFKAFEPIRLSPWTADDCIAYFNRQREREGRPPLGPEQQAKAKAVADFIGGTPRLAQLLAEVLDTQDALTVAETMSALADRLAEYYRRRIEDLAPLGRGLLDALIRGGEPASQTALAARVGADGQSTIARAMDELQRADIIRGRPAPDSRETLYSVTDRVFVHYYRLRQGSQKARTTPLATILDFLKSFYTRDEQRAQALRHLAAGRPEEGALFSRLAMANAPDWTVGDTQELARHLDRYLDAAPQALGMDAAAMAALLESEPHQAHQRCLEARCDTPAAGAIIAVVKAQALHRLGHAEQARKTLEDAVAAAVGDPAATIIAVDELTSLLAGTEDGPLAAEIGLRLQTVPPETLPPRLAVRRLVIIAWSLGELGRHEEAVETASRAADLAHGAGDKDEEAASLWPFIVSLARLGRYEEVVDAARRAAELKREPSDKDIQAALLPLVAVSLQALGRHEEAVATAERAAEAARAAGDKGEEAVALELMAFSLGQLSRHAEAVATAERAAEAARAAGDKGEEAESLRLMAFSLRGLGRHEEAWDRSTKSLAIARAEGDRFALSLAARQAIVAAAYVPRPEAVAIYGEWVEAFRAEQARENFADPGICLSDLFVAAARARAFADLDALLERHGAWLAENAPHFRFYGSDGVILARVAEAEGRAAAYAAAAGLLPRLAAFMARLPPEKREKSWLGYLITGFAGACRDPGLLRDVATLLTPDLAPDAEQSADLLRTVADLDEAPDTAAALARADPDVATLYRRLRGLPDPPPPPPKPKKKRPKNLRRTG